MLKMIGWRSLYFFYPYSYPDSNKICIQQLGPNSELFICAITYFCTDNVFIEVFSRIPEGKFLRLSYIFYILFKIYNVIV